MMSNETNNTKIIISAGFFLLMEKKSAIFTHIKITHLINFLNPNVFLTKYTID